MSEIMYNDPIDGNANSWKSMMEKCMVHDDKNIKGFFKSYRFLSNFHEAPVYYEGLKFPSTEAAYQAAKVVLPNRVLFQNVTPSESKKLWKEFSGDDLLDSSAEDWDMRKYDVMSVIVFDKFYRHKNLRLKLMSTENKYLEETNWWRDRDWGVDGGEGENNLGKILMKIREYWKE